MDIRSGCARDTFHFTGITAATKEHQRRRLTVPLPPAHNPGRFSIQIFKLRGEPNRFFKKT